MNQDEVVAPGDDPTLPWYGYDKLLHCISLEDLNNNGFIDHPMGPLSPLDDCPPYHAQPFMSGILHHFRDVPPIHPIFKRENWLNITDNDYQLLRPVLKVASCMLSETQIFPFLLGMTRRPRTRLNDPAAVQKYGQVLLQFDQAEHDDVRQWEVDQKGIWELLWQMQYYVDFDVDGDMRGADGLYAATRNHPTLSAFPARNGSTPSTISIPSVFLDILRGDLKASDCYGAQDFDNEAARVRTMFLLARTLIHEFMHAFWHATYEANDYNDPAFTEPFYRDHRLSEIGMAWEQVMHGGVIASNGTNPTQLTCPYGLRQSRFPGDQFFYNEPDRNDGGIISRGLPAKFGYLHHTVWAVPMDHVSKFFAPDFWASDVPAYGLRLLKPERRLGVRFFRKSNLAPGEAVVPNSETPSPDVPTREELSNMGFTYRPLSRGVMVRGRLRSGNVRLAFPDPEQRSVEDDDGAEEEEGEQMEGVEGEQQEGVEDEEQQEEVEEQQEEEVEEQQQEEGEHEQEGGEEEDDDGDGLIFHATF